MSKRWSGIPKSRRHIQVYNEDWDWLTSRYTGSPLGAGAACAEIIHNRVKRMRQLEIDLAEQKRWSEQFLAGSKDMEPTQ